MFENDTPVPFSFGPDLGTKVDLGKMKIIDLYEERYLVGHCHWNGELTLRKTFPFWYSYIVTQVVNVWWNVHAASCQI